MNSGTLKGFPDKPVKGELLTATANGRIELATPVTEIPSGGSPYQFLTKNSANNLEFTEYWHNVSNVLPNVTYRTTIGWNMESGASDGANKIVIVGSNSYSIYSTDAGKTWSTPTLIGTNDLWKIIYVSSLNLWVTVGSAGQILTSSDGITWTARTANMGTNAIYDVIYANGKFVAVGAGLGTTGGITTSTNGTTWTRYTGTPTIGATLYSIVWDGTRYIAGGTTATNNSLISTDAVTWTAQLIPNLNDIAGLWYDPITNSCVAISTLYMAYWSATGTGTTSIAVDADQRSGGGWATLPVGTSAKNSKGYYYNGTFYYAGTITGQFKIDSSGVSTNNKFVPAFTWSVQNNGTSPYYSIPTQGFRFPVGSNGEVIVMRAGRTVLYTTALVAS